MCGVMDHVIYRSIYIHVHAPLYLHRLVESLITYLKMRALLLQLITGVTQPLTDQVQFAIQTTLRPVDCACSAVHAQLKYLFGKEYVYLLMISSNASSLL